MTQRTRKTHPTIRRKCARCEKRRYHKQRMKRGKLGVTRWCISCNQLYHIWHQMKRRCYDEKAHNYERFGARGIGVCKRWQAKSGFENWFADMGPRPSPHHQMSRTDPSKNYQPSNCQWELQEERMGRSEVNVLITYDGETHTLAEWSRITGIHKNTLQQRHAKGLTPEQIIETPIAPTGRNCPDSHKTRAVALRRQGWRTPDIAAELDVHPQTIQRWINKFG